MKKILIFIGIALISITSLFGYNLTEKDDAVIDEIENNLIEKIDDESNKITAERVVEYIEKILARKNIPERARVILEIVLDDIEYEYYLGEYSDDYTMTADDCYEDEYFDTQSRQCIFDESYYDGDDTDYEVNFSHSHEEHDENIQILAGYSINGDTISLTQGNDSVRGKEVWNIFMTLIPLSARIDFLNYFVVNDTQSDTAAHVEQDSEDNTKWNMAVNLDSFYVDGELDTDTYATLIHEFAHVLTLSKKQMRYLPVTDNEDILQRFEESCQTNFVQEGCLNEDAYLDDFIDTFWSDKEFLEKVRNEEVNAYDGNESKFITDYAATNPGEDIAESFTYYVLKTKPVGNTIADKKLRFFYEYTPLVNLRKQIRGRLDSVGY